nr:hypothetical protein BdHM001_04880 [Bdellovibrio sp. HM001]
MRWSKTMLTLGMIASCATLTACKKEKIDGASIHTVRTKPAAEKSTTSQKQAEDTKKTSDPATTADASNLTVGQRCYQDLCAANAEVSLTKLMTDAASANETLKKYYDEHLAPQVLATVNARIEQTSATLAYFAEKEAQFDKVEVAEDQARLIKAIYVLVRPEATETQKSIIGLLGNEAFIKAHTLKQVKGASAYFTAIHNGKNLTDATKVEINKILELEEKINNAAKGRILNMKTGALQRFLNGEVIEMDELEGLADNSFALRLIDAVMDEKNNIAQQINLDLAEMKQIYGKATLKEQLKDLESLKTEMLNLCQKEMTQALNLYPQESEVTAFKATTEQVRKQVLSLLSAQDPAYQVVQKAVVYSPMTNEKAVKFWSQSLKDLTADSKDAISDLKNLDTSGTFTLATILSMTLNPKPTNCFHLVDLRISDAAHTTDTGIKASWLSVKKPSYGVAILAHEFGHLVSKFSQSFNSQKSCLAGKQGSTRFIEEDFADVIAGKVMTGMQNSLNGKSNYGCLFASTEGTPSLQVEKEDTETIHSTGLFRSLQLAQLSKAAIPESCKQAVQQQAPKALDKCE